MKSKHAKLLFSLFVVIILSLGVVTAVITEPKKAVDEAANKGVKVADIIVVTAEVVGIDKEKRIVTLRGPKKNIVDVHAGEDVRNFDQIGIGDKVKITYYESVALFLGEPGTQPQGDVGVLKGRAAKGEKPGAFAIGTIDISAKIKSIDKENRKITLELPEGNVLTTKVNESEKAFSTLKVGDSIHARLTKAIAISVQSI